jgi:hypothetical protein
VKMSLGQKDDRFLVSWKLLCASTLACVLWDIPAL